MVECSKVNVKLTNMQLKKLKNAVKKKKTGTTLRINLKMLNRNNLPHELLLTTRQKHLGSLSSKLPGPLMKVAVPSAKNILAPLGITAADSAIDGGIQEKNIDLGH